MSYHRALALNDEILQAQSTSFFHVVVVLVVYIISKLLQAVQQVQAQATYGDRQSIRFFVSISS